MTSMLQPLVLLIAALASPASNAPTASQAVPTKSTHQKKAPTIKTDVEADYPSSEKAAKNGGRVVIKGVVNLEGRLEAARVERTNASAVLTAAALTSAQAIEFNPATDETGAIVAVPISLPYVFESAGVSPDTITFVKAKYGDAEKAAGMTGEVIVEGVIGDDGHLRNTVVADSSRSAALDAAAVAAAEAAVFRVYRDGDGNALNKSIKVSYDFSNHGPGAQSYGCDQFVRDEIWWRANWPQDKKRYIYEVYYGMYVARHLTFSQNSKDVPTNHSADFEAIWAQTIETCRKKPKARFVDVFK